MLKGACIPLRVHTVVISLQHSDDITVDELRLSIRENVINKVIPAKYLDENTVFHIQPSGRFVIGGPQVSVAARRSTVKVLCSSAAKLSRISVLLSAFP
ncbi:MAG: hypothetical protein DIZ80_00010, partial [endosymbiont of Galathealinum brachiosum]